METAYFHFPFPMHRKGGHNELSWTRLEKMDFSATPFCQRGCQFPHCEALGFCCGLEQNCKKA